MAPFEALALMGLGRCLIALDRHNDALGPLHEARTILAEMGARPDLIQVDALIAQAIAQTS